VRESDLSRRIAGRPVTVAEQLAAYRSGLGHVLVASSAASGAVRFERPIDPPVGDYTTEQQRAALALSHTRVYIAYGGLFGDCGSYRGWVLGGPESAPGGALITYEVPSANEGGSGRPRARRSTVPGISTSRPGTAARSRSITGMR
jgi:hypothetical protein